MYPPILKKEMRKRIEYDPSIEISVKGFIKFLIQEAINCQAYGSCATNSESDQTAHKTIKHSKEG